MKRLIRKANENLEEMIGIIDDIAAWCKYDMNSLDVEKVISLNQDCLTNAKVYRAMGMENDWFLEDIIETSNFPITIGEICDQIKEKGIFYDDKYSSFTTDLSFAEEWNDINNFQQTSVEYILVANKTGLDIEKIYNKWKDEIDTPSMQVINECLYAKEIICKFDDDFNFHSLHKITNMGQQIESIEEAIKIFELE